MKYYFKNKHLSHNYQDFDTEVFAIDSYIDGIYKYQINNYFTLSASLGLGYIYLQGKEPLTTSVKDFNEQNTNGFLYRIGITGDYNINKSNTIGLKANYYTSFKKLSYSSKYSHYNGIDIERAKAYKALNNFSYGIVYKLSL